MNIWDLKQAADYLHRSESAIRNLAARGRIPYRKAGGRLVFIEAEIISWVLNSPGKTIDDLRERDRQ